MKKKKTYFTTLLVVSLVGFLILGCAPQRRYTPPSKTLYAHYTSSPSGAKIYFGANSNSFTFLCNTPCKRQIRGSNPSWSAGYLKAEKSGYKDEISDVNKTFATRTLHFTLEDVNADRYKILIDKMEHVRHYYRVNDGSAVLYRYPSAGSEEVVKLKKIDVVKVTGALSNGWLQISEAGKIQGYIHKSTAKKETTQGSLLDTELSVIRRLNEQKEAKKKEQASSQSSSAGGSRQRTRQQHQRGQLLVID